jgi:hypothetical protein
MSNESYSPPLASPAPEHSISVVEAVPAEVPVAVAVVEAEVPVQSLINRFGHFEDDYMDEDPEINIDYPYLNSTQGAYKFACTNYIKMVKELYDEWNASKNPEIAKQLFALIFVFYYKTRDRTNYGTPRKPIYKEECLNVICINNKLISLTTYTENRVCKWMIPDGEWQPFITSFNVLSEMQGENREIFASYFNEANSLIPKISYFFRGDQRTEFLKDFPEEQTAEQIYILLTTSNSILTSFADFKKIVTQQRVKCKGGMELGGSKRKTRRRQKKRKTKRRKTRR